MSEASRLRGGEGYEARKKGPPGKPKGFSGERRSGGMSEASRLRGGEGYEARDDEVTPRDGHYPAGVISHSTTKVPPIWAGLFLCRPFQGPFCSRFT